MFNKKHQKDQNVTNRSFLSFLFQPVSESEGDSLFQHIEYVHMAILCVLSIFRKTNK